MLLPPVRRALLAIRALAGAGLVLLVVGALLPWADIRSPPEGYYDKDYSIDLWPIAALIGGGTILCVARLVRGRRVGRGVALAGVVLGLVGVALLWAFIPVWNASLSDETVTADSGATLVTLGVVVLAATTLAAPGIRPGVRR